MSNTNRLGMGVLLGYLGGNKDSVEAFKEAQEKEIVTLHCEEDGLYFTFTDGTGLCLFDGGQSCCESRYMLTDDDLSYFIGSTLMDAEVREGPDVPCDYGAHETAFLVVTTSQGHFTCVTHNEHNGWYGGFLMAAKPWEPKEQKDDG